MSDASNVQEYSVSEISGAVRRTVEDAFGYVRVRGELGRVSRSGNGHCYLDMKDDKAVLSSVIWKGTFGRLKIKPEQGMEVIATGRLTTFPGQSRYQLVIDTLEPAGEGALMALLEARKKQLAAEGLFDPARKKPLPVMPAVIGVVTSPTGAVIRDILHRLRDRFPSHVLVWPTMVQGEKAAPMIAAGIDGFNRLEADGPTPRPDVLIVARGGGSLEDLWCFNEEVVARAVAASDIPVISAVGHETDTTLIDYVSDRRAPTPTAAAEMAVPVRIELLSDLTQKAGRLSAASLRVFDQARLGLTAAARGLGRPDGLIGPAEQRLDRASDRLAAALRGSVDGASARISRTAGRFSPALVAHGVERQGDRLASFGQRLTTAPSRSLEEKRRSLAALKLPARTLATSVEAQGLALRQLGTRARRAMGEAQKSREARLTERGRLLNSFSYQGVLERGFALARTQEGDVIRSASAVAAGSALSLTFADGTAQVVGAAGDAPPPAAPPAPAKKRKPQKASPPPKAQKGLFD